MTAQHYDFRVSPELASDLRQWRGRALAAGILGAALCAVGFFVDHDQFYRSYLWSYVYIVGIAVGSMAWLMLQRAVQDGEIPIEEVCRDCNRLAGQRTPTKKLPNSAYTALTSSKRIS